MGKRTKLFAVALMLGAGAVPALAQQSIEESAGGLLAPDVSLPSDELPAVDADAQVQSVAVINVINWVLGSNDNGGLPFMIIDKQAAEAFLFDPAGNAVGETSVLIGSAEGDASIPGIGNRELKEIKPEERTTPAGRFVVKFGPALGKYREVLWVNFADSIALHPVPTGDAAEGRPKRLKSETPLDNRITYGCINVPAQFYKEVVRPLFLETTGIAYVLPEHSEIASVLPGFRPGYPAPSAPMAVIAAEGR